MVTRAILGDRAGVKGSWITKPGYDANNAPPGRYLLDTNSQVFQTILKGTVGIMREGLASIPAGSQYAVAVPLPAEFAGFDRIVVDCSHYAITNAGVYFGENNIGSSYLKWNANGGAFTVTMVFRQTGGTGSSLTWIDHYAAFSIFRAQF